jgi:hypothetical protein
MSMRDQYRTKAAEFHARARIESNEMTRRQYESLAQQYSKLAEQVERRRAPELIGERRHARANRRK